MRPRCRPVADRTPPAHERGLGLDVLADRAGLYRNHVGLVERGLRSLSIEVVRGWPSAWSDPSRPGAKLNGNRPGSRRGMTIRDRESQERPTDDVKMGRRVSVGHHPAHRPDLLEDSNIF